MLVGNVGTILGGIEAFEHASPTTVASSSASSPPTGLLQWTRALSRTALGNAEKSPFVHTTSGKKFDVRMDKSTPYELDGGDREDQAAEDPRRAGRDPRLRPGRHDVHEHRDAGSRRRGS